MNDPARGLPHKTMPPDTGTPQGRATPSVSPRGTETPTPGGTKESRFGIVPRHDIKNEHPKPPWRCTMTTITISRPKPRLYLGCHFYDIYTDPKLDAQDRDAITDLLLSAAGHHEIFERLAPMNLGVSEKMIERHRRSLCTCGRI